MSDFRTIQKEPNDIIALAKFWATRQLAYIPQHPYRANYPRNSAVRVDAYSNIVKGISPYLPPESALALLNFVTQEAQSALPEYYPDDDLYHGWTLVIKALGNLVTGYLQIEAYAAALQTAHSINDEVRRVGAIANVASVLFQKERFLEAQEAYASAEQAANAVTNVYVQYEAYTVLLESALQIKGAEAAVGLSEKVKSQGTFITLRFHSLIRNLIARNQLPEAQKVADCLTNKVERAKALSEIAVALANAGMPDLSKAMISKLEGQLMFSRDPAEQLSLLCSMGIAFCKMGDVPHSGDVLSRAAEVAQSITTRYLPVPIFEYPMALAACGYYDTARQAVQMITSTAERQEAILRLTTFLEENSKFEEADKTASLIDEKYWQARAPIRSANLLLNHGQVENADKLLDEVIVLLKEFHFTGIQPLDHYLVTQMLVYFHRIPESFEYLDRAGIDEFLKALSNASPYFERLDKGLAVQVIKSVIEIAAQKHPDYLPILNLIG